MKTASLVLCLLAAAPPGAALASPYGGPPPGAAPPFPVAAPPPTAPSPAADAPPEAPSFGPPSEAAPPAAPVAAPPRRERSPMLAFGLSFIVPIAAVLAGAYVVDPDEDPAAAVIVGSVVVGPSLGWFYAGRPGYGLATAAARLAGFALAIQVLDDRPGSNDEGAILAGAALIVTTTLIDWIGTPLVVASDNASARTAILPAVYDGGGGLSIAGAF